MAKIEGDLADALTVLRDYFENKRIPFALVGAIVPALLLSPGIGTRETRDADQVIKLASWAGWDAVIADLVELGFKRGHGEQEHRLYYRTAEIDLIPYGLTEGPEEILVWRKSGNKMNMAGFSDVFKHAKPIQVSRGVTIPVVPLWLFAVLKVTAYLDRKLARDIYDLVYVLEKYELADEGSRRFDLPGESEGITYETAGAYLLGCDICTNVSPKALNLVKGFAAEITDEHHYVINTSLREENRLFSDDRRALVYRLIQAFQKGLQV